MDWSESSGMMVSWGVICGERTVSMEKSYDLVQSLVGWFLDFEIEPRKGKNRGKKTYLVVVLKELLVWWCLVRSVWGLVISVWCLERSGPVSERSGQVSYFCNLE